VIQPGYEYLAQHQQHITGDISFGLRYYLALSHDIDFMKSEGCQMAKEIAEFWASRVTFNESTQLYDINHVMGPDEDHDDIDNNLFTNVIAKLALDFGS
jgi:trehalose/maltose hydrolase-like predicted phosphorylase